MAKKEVAWEHRIQCKKNGERYGSLGNAQLAFSYDSKWRDVLAFDEFVGDIVTTKLPPWHKNYRPSVFKHGEWTDNDMRRAALWLEQEHEIRVSIGTVKDALLVVSDMNRRHPARDWLKSLKWDRSHLLDEMFIRICGARDEPYSREISKNFLIGAVARIMKPGCQLDSMPIIEGRQGVGKTSFFKALFGEQWFLSSNIDITSKDGYQVLARKWCVELGELESLRERQVAAIKRYVSQSVDTYRPSYGHKAQDFPRQCVFAGTTNDFAYLKDGTGARRFWPLVVLGIKLEDGRFGVDLNLLQTWRDQLFAEAYFRYKQGEAWHITDPELLKEHAIIAEEKREVDPWEVSVAKWVDKRLKTKAGRVNISNNGISTDEVLVRALHVPRGQHSKHDEMRAAETLRAIGFVTRERVSIGGARSWTFKNPKIPSEVKGFETEEVSQVRRKKPLSVRPTYPNDKTS
jgi:putative DNA primase/helicase